MIGSWFLFVLFTFIFMLFWGGPQRESVGVVGCHVRKAVRGGGGGGGGRWVHGPESVFSGHP